MNTEKGEKKTIVYDKNIGKSIAVPISEAYKYTTPKWGASFSISKPYKTGETVKVNVGSEKHKVMADVPVKGEEAVLKEGKIETSLFRESARSKAEQPSFVKQNTILPIDAYKARVIDRETWKEAEKNNMVFKLPPGETTKSMIRKGNINMAIREEAKNPKVKIAHTITDEFLGFDALIDGATYYLEGKTNKEWETMRQSKRENYIKEMLKVYDNGKDHYVGKLNRRVSADERISNWAHIKGLQGALAAGMITAGSGGMGAKGLYITKQGMRAITGLQAIETARNPTTRNMVTLAAFTMPTAIPKIAGKMEIGTAMIGNKKVFTGVAVKYGTGVKRTRILTGYDHVKGRLVKGTPEMKIEDILKKYGGEIASSDKGLQSRVIYKNIPKEIKREVNALVEGIEKTRKVKSKFYQGVHEKNLDIWKRNKIEEIKNAQKSIDENMRVKGIERKIRKGDRITWEEYNYMNRIKRKHEKYMLEQMSESRRAAERYNRQEESLRTRKAIEGKSREFEEAEISAEKYNPDYVRAYRKMLKEIKEGKGGEEFVEKIGKEDEKIIKELREARENLDKALEYTKKPGTRRYKYRRFITKLDGKSGTKTLTSKQLKRLIELEKKYGTEIYGSFSDRPQMSYEGQKRVEPSDVDTVHLIDEKGGIKRAKEYIKELRKADTTGYKLRISPERKTLIEAKVGKEWKHAIDMHTKQDMEGVPEGMWGYKYSDIPSTNIEGIKSMRLAESTMRRGGSASTIEMRKGKLEMSPKEHRIKDMARYIEGQTDLILSMKPGKSQQEALKRLEKYKKIIIEKYGRIPEYKGEVRMLLRESPSLSKRMVFSNGKIYSFSKSRSKNRSFSPSASYSRSPSTSYSPSASYSRSPSTSYSPSASYSKSPSASYSRSPSTSYSPSASYSRSPSYGYSRSPSYGYSVNTEISHPPPLLRRLPQDEMGKNAKKRKREKEDNIKLHSIDDPLYRLTGKSKYSGIMNIARKNRYGNIYI